MSKIHDQPAPSFPALHASERRLEQVGEGRPMTMTSEPRRYSRHHPDKP